MKNTIPKQIGYKGIEFLEEGDNVFYKIEADKNYARATVTKAFEAGATAIFVKLEENYRGNHAKFKAGEEILAGPNELYRIPKSKLEERL